MTPVFTLMTACGFPPLSLMLIYVILKLANDFCILHVCREENLMPQVKPLKTRKPNQIELLYFHFTLRIFNSSLWFFSFVLSPGDGTNKICFHKESCMFQPPFYRGNFNKNLVEVWKFWKFCTWKFSKTVLRPPAPLDELRIHYFGMNIRKSHKFPVPLFFLLADFWNVIFTFIKWFDIST